MLVATMVFTCDYETIVFILSRKTVVCSSHRVTLKISRKEFVTMEREEKWLRKREREREKIKFPVENNVQQMFSRDTSFVNITLKCSYGETAVSKSVEARSSVALPSSLLTNVFDGRCMEIAHGEIMVKIVVNFQAP